MDANDEKRHKKRSKKPAKSPGDDSGKEDSTPLQFSGHAGTKMKSPGKEAVVSPSKTEVTGTLVTTARGGKSRKKHYKKLDDAGATAPKDEIALEVSEKAGARSMTPDAGSVASSSKADVSSASTPVGGEEKRPNKPSKHRSTTSDAGTKDKHKRMPRRPKTSPMCPPVRRRTASRKLHSRGGGAGRGPGGGENSNSKIELISGSGPQSRTNETTLPIIGSVVLVAALLVAVVVGLLVIGLTDRAEGPMVSTASGKFVGKKVSVDGLDVYCWLGIPYAESTAGKNRFRKPRPSTVTQRTIAQEPRPPCPQWVNGAVVGNEDCLHMNVWAPVESSGAGLNRTLVLASAAYWFQRGSNNDPDWAELAAKGNATLS